MSNLRFGVGSPSGPGSRYWSLTTGAKRPEVYLYGSRTGGFFGISLHENAQHWHWKVKEPGGQTRYIKFGRPRELTPGYTRALEIATHPIVATSGPPVNKASVAWHKPDAPDRKICFDVYIERSGADLSSWPGQRAMGSTFVGRRTLCDGTTVVVVANERQHQEEQFQIPISAEQRASLQRAQRTSSRLGVLLHGVADGGTPFVIDHIWESST